MRSSNLFISLVSLVALTTLTIASTFLAAILVDRTLFFHVLGRGWCFGLFIAALSLVAVGTIGAGTVFWFGTERDQGELKAALVIVGQWYALAATRSFHTLAQAIEWTVVVARGGDEATRVPVSSASSSSPPPSAVTNNDDEHVKQA